MLVSGAAGAVGHIVGQLAKNWVAYILFKIKFWVKKHWFGFVKGCKAIGVVGSEEKANWCKKDLGFDHVIDYKKVNWSDALKEIAPDGVDVYFDNVGGEYYTNVINRHMKLGGRVLVCGSIQNYNDIDKKLVEATNINILMKELTVKGFMCYSYFDKWPLAFVEMNKLIQEVIF